MLTLQLFITRNITLITLFILGIFAIVEISPELLFSTVHFQSATDIALYTHMLEDPIYETGSLYTENHTEMLDAQCLETGSLHAE